MIPVQVEPEVYLPAQLSHTACMQKMCICEVTRLLQLRSTSRLSKVRHCYRTSAAAETEAVFQQSSIHICKLSLNLAPAQFHHRQQVHPDIPW